MQTRYTYFSNKLVEATEQIVPVESRRANQVWMINDLLFMIKERRPLKHNDFYIGRKMLKSRENDAKRKKNVITEI